MRIRGGEEVGEQVGRKGAKERECEQGEVNKWVRKVGGNGQGSGRGIKCKRGRELG
jgi:hypothetical protein